MQATELSCIAPKCVKAESDPQMARLADIGKAVSCISHEMRNSLQRIMLGIDELRLELNGNEEGAKTLEYIDHDVDTLKDIVRDLLDYSKPLILRYSLCSISEIVATALERVSHRLNGISIRADVDEEGSSLPMDREKIVRVFVNIITNAVDAMPEGGELAISATRHWREGEETSKISFTDSGRGIDEQDIQEIQQPFVTTKAQGIGLGIPICKNIISAHNGGFEIQSVSGLGTTVEIALPTDVP